MMLHHELVGAAAPAIFAIIAWVLLALNAIGFYGRKLWRRFKGGA